MVIMQDNKRIDMVPYHYRHASVPGGGFVTGFCFHPKQADILYARTDIGGVYRYDFKQQEWISLMDHVTALEKWESYPLSIALDPANPSWLYVVAGNFKENYLCRSKDYGDHFEYFPLPASVHGNAPGRGTGERLQVDPHNSGILYFGSQSEGLLISEDYGEHFQALSVNTKEGNTEKNLAFVWVDPRSFKDDRCQTIIVAASGKENSPGGNYRGPSLYFSKDAGTTFHIMPGQPSAGDFGAYPGYVGQRITRSGDYVFITMAATEREGHGWSSYACDSGGREKGCIIRYELTERGELLGYELVTPDLSFIQPMEGDVCNFAGFGGIDADTANSGYLICSTQCCEKGDAILFTEDYGVHWKPILYRLSIGEIDFGQVPYMKSEYNNNDSLIHWMSDIKINPFCSEQVFFNTGTGIFTTCDLLNGKSDRPVHWAPSCKGLEETVHLNVYSPPKGDVKLIDIIGDLGAFAFTDLTKPAENSFADENHHRYITCLCADYPDAEPRFVAVCARGNWIGKTTGGLIWSEDQCKTFRRLSDPYGISERIDKLIDEIRKPNTNSGWTAISSDGRTLVWCVGERFSLPMEAVVFTEDLGETWQQSRIYDLQGKALAEENNTLKVFSDRVDPEVLYGFGEESRIYVSTDRARSFYQVKVPDNFPKLELAGIDGKMSVEIRMEAGKTGVAWISLGEGGLWKLIFNKRIRTAEFLRISKEKDVIFRQGMGKAAPESLYNTLYVNGIIDGIYGFYRSINEGETWQRINTNKQMYGDIRSIAGDPRCFGRFYLATGSRGVLWGEPTESAN